MGLLIKNENAGAENDLRNTLLDRFCGALPAGWQVRRIQQADGDLCIEEWAGTGSNPWMIEENNNYLLNYLAVPLNCALLRT